MIRFDETPFIEVANILVEADETELALKVLESLPAYYRDNIPSRIMSFKNQIKTRITMTYDLLDDEREMPKSDEWSIQFLNHTVRGIQLKSVVQEYNQNNRLPIIYDMGPGDGTFAIGMKAEGLKFEYNPISLNKEAQQSLQEKVGHTLDVSMQRQGKIFVAYEIIEHLHHIDEIRQMFDRIVAKHGPVFHVLLSTPKYTFGNGTTNWQKEGIHHLRAYTPREFANIAISMFPEYDFQYADNEVMVLIGKLRS